MKKVLSLVAALMLVCACALAETAEPAIVTAEDQAEFNGVWGNAFVFYGGAPHPMSEAGLSSSMEIKDGIVTYLMDDKSATWSMELKEGTLQTGEGEGLVIIALHEGEVASASMGGSTIYYEKIQLAAMDEPTPILAENLAQFDGAWGNSFAINNGLRYPTSMFGLAASMEIVNGVATINMGGGAADIPMSLENGALTISASASTMTITLCEGDIIALVMNGSSPIYCERVK
ncbi:MAG: hypothetical protein IJ461_05285 [Clostridia bacterium]|nr:hypothetical protein [Clostridia bacterium]